MTREDAKRTLQDMWECLFNEMTNHTFEDLKEHGMLDNYATAFDMAISALSENKGEDSEMNDVLDRISAEINTPNRGNCDYFIVDQIEQIISEYREGVSE